MKISRNILEWLNPILKKLSDQQIKESLESLGLEVEHIERRFPKEENKNLVYGFLEDVSKVQGSDKLSLCSVRLLEGNNDNYKKDQVLQIICGGSNLVNKTVVIVSLPGQKIKDVVIGKRKVFGVESEGMICSFAELDVTGNTFHEKSGIARFTTKKQTGSNIPLLDIKKNPTASSLLSDTIFHCESVQNSHYLHSNILLARLIEVMNNISKKTPIQMNQAREYFAGVINKLFISSKSTRKLNISEKLKNHVLGKLFVVESEEIMNKFNTLPKSLFISLNYVGFNLINPLVDLLNLFSYVAGQPIHTYDNDKVKVVNVIKSEKDKKLLVLGQKWQVVPKNAIVIEDNEHNLLAVPSIIGSHNSALSISAKSVLVEILSIEPSLVRGTLNKMQIASIASEMGKKNKGKFPFEIAKLLFEKPKAEERTKILTMNVEWLITNIGLEEKKDINILSSLLKKLEVDVRMKNENQLQFIIPVWLGNFADSENIIQLCYLLLSRSDYYHTEVTTQPVRTNSTDGDQFLQWAGYTKVKTYTLVDDRRRESFRLDDVATIKQEVIKVQDEMTNRHQTIASSLISCLLPSFEINARFQKEEIKIFAEKKLPETLKNSSKRFSMLHAFKNKSQFNTNFQNMLELTKKFIFLKCGKHIEFQRNEKVVFGNKSNTQNVLLDGAVVGVIGELNPIITLKHQFSGLAIFTEINFSKITPINDFQKHNKIYHHPMLVKELTFIMDEDTDATMIEHIIKQNNLVEKCNIIDFFVERNEDVLVSVTFQIYFYQKEIISDVQLNELLKEIVNNIKRETQNQVKLKGQL